MQTQALLWSPSDLHWHHICSFPGSGSPSPHTLFFFFSSCCKLTQRPELLSCLGPPLKAIWAVGVISTSGWPASGVHGHVPSCLDRRGLPSCSSQDAMSRWPDKSGSWRHSSDSVYVCAGGGVSPSPGDVASGSKCLSWQKLG